MNNEIDLSTIPLDTGAPLVAEPDKRARELVYVPTRQRHSVISEIIGAVCRAVVAAGFVTGLAYLFADAFKIIPDKTTLSAIVIPALLFSASLSLLSCGKRLAPIGLLAFIGAVFGELLSYALYIPGFVTEAVTAIHNAVIERFADVGQTGLLSLLIETEENSIYSENELFSGGIMLFVMLLSVLFVPAIVRRCRGFYLIPMTAVFTVPIFLYNIMETNWGFAVFVSAAAGVVSLWLYDRRYTRVTKKKRLVGEHEVMPDPLEGIERKKTRGEKRLERESKKASKRKKVKGAKKSSADELHLETSKARRRRIREEKKRRKSEKKAAAAERRTWKRGYLRAQRLDSDTARASYAFGGVTGLFTFALAAAVIVLPARFVEESDPGLPYLSEVMSTARKYVTSFLSSDRIDLNDPQYMDGAASGDSRSTEATYPEYEDIVIANVNAPYKSPIYLRTWIGTRYENDRWYSATFDEIESYDERFGAGFTPETLTENFYEAIFPAYARYSPSTGYRANTERGFISERVSVTRTAGNTPILMLPSFVRPSMGLLSYGTSEPSRMPYNKYFDGIWTSRYFFEGSSYSTDSLVTTMRSTDLGGVFADEIGEYEATLALIRSGEPDRLIGGTEDEIERYLFETEHKIENEYGIELPAVSMLRRYITQMTDEARARILANAELEERYADYVYDTYLETDIDNDEIRDVAQSVLASYNADVDDGEKPGVENYHTVIMMLVEYLNDNFTYTKTRPEPTPETTDTVVTDAETDDGESADTDEVTDAVDEKMIEPDKSAVVEFLTETKTGYCVQFASSLTLMLRSIGIPARYCEGYLADDFETEQSMPAMLRYKTDVLDSDAHAWVEVYYDGLGWVQYEATPAMHDGMYGNLSMEPSDDIGDAPGIGSHTPTNIPDHTPDEPDEGDEIEQPETDDSERIVKIALIIAASVGGALLLGLIVYLIVLHRRGKNSCRRRRELVERCCDVSRPMTEDEIRRDAHDIDLGIYDIYSALGLPPRIGELSDEYASRLTPFVGKASTYPLSTVLGHISNEEFGHSLGREELSELAKYYGDLIKNVYIGLSHKNRLVFRYIKRVV